MSKTTVKEIADSTYQWVRENIIPKLSYMKNCSVLEETRFCDGYAEGWNDGQAFGYNMRVKEEKN